MAENTALLVCETTSAVFRWTKCVLPPDALHLYSFNIAQKENARSNRHGGLLTDQDLVYAPFPPNDVESSWVLDLGFGTGGWCSKLLDDPDNGDCRVSVNRLFRQSDLG